MEAFGKFPSNVTIDGGDVCAEASPFDAVEKRYFDALQLIERVNARLLEVIKDELDRRREKKISTVQALLLFNLGDRTLTAGELRARGCYFGSNVSYNLKKLVEAGYIEQERNHIDQRSVLVRLTPKGERVHAMLAELFTRHAKSLEAASDVKAGDLEATNTALKRLERFWIDQVRFRL